MLRVSVAALWLVATAWIPVLLTAGAWRVMLQWSAIFPVGMYGVCTARVAQLFGVPALATVARSAVAVALGLWTLTLARLVWQVAREGAARARWRETGA